MVSVDIPLLHKKCISLSNACANRYTWWCVAFAQTVHDGFHCSLLQGRTPMRANLHMRDLATSHECCKTRADAKSGSGRWVFGVVIQIGALRFVGRCRTRTKCIRKPTTADLVGKRRNEESRYSRFVNSSQI